MFLMTTYADQQVRDIALMCERHGHVIFPLTRVVGSLVSETLKAILLTNTAIEPFGRTLDSVVVAALSPHPRLRLYSVEAHTGPVPPHS
jgi:hypothetical protein